MANKLTAERCDECIYIRRRNTNKRNTNKIVWNSSFNVTEGNDLVSPDEAELFAYRLLAAVKRARGDE